MSNPPTSEEDFSDQFDNISSGDLSEFTDAQSKLADDWAQLGACLKQLPVPSVSLVSDVRRQIERASLVVAARHPPVQSPPRHSAFAVMVSSLTMVVCLFSLMYFPAPLPNLTFQQSLFSGFTSRELASGLSNCDVVLITMPDGPEETTDFLRTSLTNSGMESHSIAVDSKPSSDSQLLGSNADSSQVLGALTALHAIGGEPVDDMEREQILAQLLEAIETPSLAEEHFNDFVVVVPRDVIDGMRKHGGMVADASMPKNVGSSPEIVPAETRKVVFVVRRKKVSGADHIDSNGAGLQSTDFAAGEA